MSNRGSFWSKFLVEKVMICNSGHNLHEDFVPTNICLGHLGFLIPPRSSFCFKFHMFLAKVSHSRASSCGVSKWRLLICQSNGGLCRTIQHNPMITRFFGDEMTLKTTLLMCEPMVTFDALVSCVIGPDERFWPSTTSTGTSVPFSTRTNLYCCTNSLSIKRAYALKSRNAWASIVTSLLHLTMIGTNNHGARFEDKLAPFSLHDASKCNLIIPIKTKHARFPTPLIVDW